MKRIQELDTAKGIGILLVILGHSLILGGGQACIEQHNSI